MFEPKNEQGVVALFMMSAKSAGWEVVEIGAPFPDAKLARLGETWLVEFEYMASNFVTHGHDYRQCDLIICWKNDLRDCPLPILALSEQGWERRKPVKGNPLASELEYWKKRALSLERELSKKSRKKEHVQANRPTSYDDQMAMLTIYQSEPALSDEKMAAKIGKSKKTIQDLLADLSAKEVVYIEKVGRGKTVAVNGKFAAFKAGEI